MLTITEPAADFLMRAREQSGAPSDAALRVGPSANDNDGPLTLAFVPEPLTGDAVTDAFGLAVCVAPEINEAVDAATLDVVEEEGREHLVLRGVG